MIVSVLRALTDSGLRKAGTPSEMASTPVNAAQPEANARRITSAPSAPRPGAFVLDHHRFVYRESGRGIADEPDPQHDEYAEQEEIGGNGENRSRFAQTAQVYRRDEENQEDANQHPVLVELRYGGRHRRDRCGNTHRNRQHIVGQQRGAGGERRELAKIVLGDDIRATALRIGFDRLPVGDPDDDQQRHNGRANRQALGKRQQAAGHEEHPQDLFRGIGDGRKRIRREHCERFRIGKSLVIGRGRRHRRADQDAFDALKSPANRSARFRGIFGGDQMAGTGPFEIVGLLPDDAHIAVADVRAEHLLLAGKIALQARFRFAEGGFRAIRVAGNVLDRWHPDRIRPNPGRAVWV